MVDVGRGLGTEGLVLVSVGVMSIAESSAVQSELCSITNALYPPIENNIKKNTTITLVFQSIFFPFFTDNTSQLTAEIRYRSRTSLLAKLLGHQDDG